jgi:hypothetical protein
MSYKLRSESFLLLLVCAAGLWFRGVFLLAAIAGLSGGTGTIFFFFFTCAFAFLLSFLCSVGVDVEGGDVVSLEDMTGNSMASRSGWFEPLSDLHVKVLQFQRIIFRML